jgi:glycosyltransferase involved in cell wall biosynthesis
LILNNSLKFNNFYNLKVFVFGTRGFPDIQGGVEQHCENLYPLFASTTCQVTVFRRKPYILNKGKKFNNIAFIDLPSTRIPGFEALFHSFLSTVISILKRPELIHIHNIGPGIFAPLLKMFGLKVILTYHSPNYEHNKWSKFGKYFLKLAEILALKFSDRVIFVSLFQKNKLGSNPKFIHINNGVRIFPETDKNEYINHLGLQRNNYVLAVGRFVEEKGFELLIRAFSKTAQRGVRLVIAGDADHETASSIQIKKLARENNVVLTGFVVNEKLQQLYCHSRLFVLPSYNEGQPLSLLEAMSYRLPVLASDIAANLQLNLPDDNYFIAGNEESLIEKLNQQLKLNFVRIDYDLAPYNWNMVASQTVKVYEDVLTRE